MIPLADFPAGPPAAVRSRVWARVALFAVLTVVPYVIAHDVLDYPGTWSCSDPPADAAETRSGYLPGALAVSLFALTALVGLAWSWVAGRSEHRGGSRGPRALALCVAIPAAVAHGLALRVALEGEQTGGALIGSFLVAGAGAVLAAVCLVCLILQLHVVRPDSPHWAERAESLSASAAWLVAFSVWPFFVVTFAAAATDATLFC